MSLDINSTEPRRRATNIKLLNHRLANQTAAPFHTRVANWQGRLAHLRTLKMLRPGGDVQAQAAELVPLVVAARIELEEAVVDLGDAAIATQGPVLALRASLDRLREELETLSTVSETQG